MNKKHAIGLDDRPPGYLIAIFFIFAILVLGLAFFQVRGNVYSAFHRPDKSTKIAQEDELQAALDKVLEEQTKDTDQDGLPDYDEIYLYQTSPYLVDSDSDTLSDYEEVSTGSDPNCARGTDCDRLGTLDSDSQDLTRPDTTSILEDVLPTEAEQKDLLVPSGAELRRILAGSGQADLILENFTDEELEDLFAASYDQVYEDAADAASALEGLAGTSGEISLEDLQEALGLTDLEEAEQ